MTPLPASSAPRRPIARAPRAFTLIEILIVIAVIVILASIAMVIGVGVMNSARERATKATMTNLDGAMSLFLKDHPEPGTADATGTKDWVAALRAFPQTSKDLDNTNKLTNTGGSFVVLDAWGTPIKYIPSTTSAKKVGFFQSAGRDNKPGTSDDLFSEGAAATP